MIFNYSIVIIVIDGVFLLIFTKKGSIFKEDILGGILEWS